MSQPRPSAGRSRRLLVLLSCVVAALALTAGSAAAKKKSTPVLGSVSRPLPVIPGSGYLALGDSVTFGYQEAQVVPAPNYHNAASFIGYPQQVGAALHLTVANAACSGETAASLVNAKAQSNGCENAPGSPSTGYRTQFPLHVKYNGSQLDYAVAYLKSHHSVRLVSLMIGANDFFVCQETTADHCAAGSELAATKASVTKNIKTILSAIRNKAKYTGQLVIVNYYSLNYGSAAQNALSTLLNTTQDNAAKSFHVRIANGFGELQTAAAHSGGNTCTAGLLTQLGTPGTCGIHPSVAGQTLLAESVDRVLTLG